MKFDVYAQTVASKYLGQIEADSKETALALADEDSDMTGALYFSICHQCAEEFDLGDPDFVVEVSE